MASGQLKGRPPAQRSDCRRLPAPTINGACSHRRAIILLSLRVRESITIPGHDHPAPSVSAGRSPERRRNSAKRPDRISHPGPATGGLSTHGGCSRRLSVRSLPGTLTGYRPGRSRGAKSVLITPETRPPVACSRTSAGREASGARAQDRLPQARGRRAYREVSTADADLSHGGRVSGVTRKSVASSGALPARCA